MKKKIPFPAALGCIILFLLCCGCLAYGCFSLSQRCKTLETQASQLEEDNSKLEDDNSKLNTELTDSTAQLEEKEHYLAGQKEYISELSEQIDAFTDEDGNDSDDSGEGADNDSDSDGSDEDSDNPYPNLYAEGHNPKEAKKVGVQKNNEDCEEYLSEIVERGHTLGLHSYSHNYSLIYSSKDAFLSDYEDVYDWVVEKTGYTPSLFRFPGGSNNGSSYVVNGIIDEMEERGFQYFDWNVSSGDGSELTTTANIIDNICSNVGNVDNPVVLMHDGKGKRATLAALPSVLEYLSDNGYEFLPLDKSVEPVHYR